jgi:hypothetical protein
MLHAKDGGGGDHKMESRRKLIRTVLFMALEENIHIGLRKIVISLYGTDLNVLSVNQETTRDVAI